MNNLQTQFILLLAYLAAFYIRSETLESGPYYIIAVLSGLLVSAIVMPATGAKGLPS